MTKAHYPHRKLVARQAGDMVMTTGDGKTLMLTTTGGNGNPRAIHVTICERDKPNRSITLTRQQARTLTNHIGNAL